MSNTKINIINILIYYLILPNLDSFLNLKVLHNKYKVELNKFIFRYCYLHVFYKKLAGGSGVACRAKARAGDALD